MELINSLQFFKRDFIVTIKNYREVLPFIKANQLWKGFLDYSWVTKFLLLIGVLVSLKFAGVFNDFFSQTSQQGISFNSLGSLVGNTIDEGYDLFKMSGFKYAILILSEVVIFHFARKTLEVLTGEKADATFNTFLKAQVRMFKVVLFAYVMETLSTVLVGVGLSILSLGAIKPVVNFIIQCFFLGFVIIDNYNEIFHMSIKQSFKYTRQYTGVSIGIGIVVYVLMLLPVLGAFLAPLLAAVTATITMYELDKKDDSLEEVFVENAF
ncbi:MAG: EI24 domain-containing protein [Saprospiraceae bacterium]